MSIQDHNKEALSKLSKEELVNLVVSLYKVSKLKTMAHEADILILKQEELKRLKRISEMVDTANLNRYIVLSKLPLLLILLTYSIFITVLHYTSTIGA